MCRCGGSGWALSEVDTFHECPFHYEGQPNSEDPDEAWEAWELKCCREGYKAIAAKSVSEFGRFGVTPTSFNDHARREIAESGIMVPGNELEFTPQGWLAAAEFVAEAFEQVHDYR